jgi:hypothetical protein
VGWCGTHDLSGSSKGNDDSDSFPLNIVAWATHTWRALETYSIVHGCQTHHAEQPRRHSLCVGGPIILLEKCCVHMTYNLNDRNELVLQLLQVLLVCYGGLHKYRSNEHFLADCLPHGVFCRVQWRLRDSVWIFRGPEPCAVLFNEPIEVEMDFITKPQAV